MRNASRRVLSTLLFVLALGACVSTDCVDGSGASAAHTSEGALRAVEVRDVAIDPNTESPVIILREVDGTHRELPIWIGPYEARSIALALRDVELPRPNPHDLIRNLLSAVEGKLERVEITELRDNTYFAIIRLEVAGRTVTVDSRPSDAIAVALRTETPVFAHEGVLQDAGDALDVRRPSEERRSLDEELRVH